jgi:hypothetical protein
MPWKKMSYERTIQVFKDALDEIIFKNDVDPNAFVEALMIRAEILKHDFTKRQMSILMGIYTFSYAMCKDTAYIPKLQDFQLVGVGVTKIKDELRKLEDMNVLEIDRENFLFKLKDFHEWEVPYISTFSDTRAKELYLLNLEHAGVDVTAMMDKLNKEV